MRYNLDNIREKSLNHNPVIYSNVIDKKRTYLLHNGIRINLSNGKGIYIPKWFTWDLASVPQIFHNIIRPNGDDDIAYLIHDYLYISKLTTRKFADKEMLKWAKVMKGTKNLSWRNWDVQTRYVVVRLLGWTVWNKK